MSVYFVFGFKQKVMNVINKQTGEVCEVLELKVLTGDNRVLTLNGDDVLYTTEPVLKCENIPDITKYKPGSILACTTKNDDDIWVFVYRGVNEDFILNKGKCISYNKKDGINYASGGGILMSVDECEGVRFATPYEQGLLGIHQ